MDFFLKSVISERSKVKEETAFDSLPMPVADVWQLLPWLLLLFLKGDTTIQDTVGPK